MRENPGNRMFPGRFFLDAECRGQPSGRGPWSYRSGVWGNGNGRRKESETIARVEKEFAWVTRELFPRWGERNREREIHV